MFRKLFDWVVSFYVAESRLQYLTDMMDEMVIARFGGKDLSYYFSAYLNFRYPRKYSFPDELKRTLDKNKPAKQIHKKRIARIFFYTDRERLNRLIDIMDRMLIANFDRGDLSYYFAMYLAFRSPGTKHVERLMRALAQNNKTKSQEV